MGSGFAAMAAERESVGTSSSFFPKKIRANGDFSKFHVGSSGLVTASRFDDRDRPFVTRFLRKKKRELCPEGSRSMMIVRQPRFAYACATLIDIVLFPTPPFSDAKQITLMRVTQEKGEQEKNGCEKLERSSKKWKPLSSQRFGLGILPARFFPVKGKFGAEEFDCDSRYVHDRKLTVPVEHATASLNQ